MNWSFKIRRDMNKITEHDQVPYSTLTGLKPTYPTATSSPPSILPPIFHQTVQRLLHLSRIPLQSSANTIGKKISLGMLLPSSFTTYLSATILVAGSGRKAQVLLTSHLLCEDSTVKVVTCCIACVASKELLHGYSSSHTMLY
jgi:hypothetical protein